jgi:hypothetical protein
MASFCVPVDAASVDETLEASEGLHFLACDLPPVDPLGDGDEASRLESASRCDMRIDSGEMPLLLLSPAASPRSQPIRDNCG